VLIEYVKDHLIPHIAEKTFARKMYVALVGLYQNRNTGRKLNLKHQVQVVKMSSEDTIMRYLMNITQIRDQLVMVNDTVEDVELVNVVLRGIPK